MRPSLDWLLALVPAAIALKYLAPDSQTLIFVVSALAIVPLAGWLGHATEQLAGNTSPAIGALLNATFGNAAELIIALVALREGLRDVVKASLTGSILGNLLLVLGGAALAGGLRFKLQKFNELAARTHATMMTLAAIALIVPAVYHRLAGGLEARHEVALSLAIAVVLLATYALSLLFSLRTHGQLVAANEAPPPEAVRAWSTRKAVAVLALSTVLIAWMSEILVGSVEAAAAALGMSSIFVGVVVVGIIGNAAEHTTAILAARNNQMDLAVGIAIGSSLQIALFVAPALVLASLVVGPRPMDLVFSTPEVLAVGVAIWIAGQISADGETNWLEGVQLLAVYAVLAMAFYWLPEVK